MNYRYNVKPYTVLSHFSASRIPPLYYGKDILAGTTGIVIAVMQKKFKAIYFKGLDQLISSALLLQAWSSGNLEHFYKKEWRYTLKIKRIKKSG